MQGRGGMVRGNATTSYALIRGSGTTREDMRQRQHDKRQCSNQLAHQREVAVQQEVTQGGGSMTRGNTTTNWCINERQQCNKRQCKGCGFWQREGRCIT
jgi:hypothetical protein